MAEPPEQADGTHVEDMTLEEVLALARAAYTGEPWTLRIDGHLVHVRVARLVIDGGNVDMKFGPVQH
jgi:hypothetical protein